MNQVVSEWYGVKDIPARIVFCQDEIDEFIQEHDEVSPLLWHYVDHTRRHLNMWKRVVPCVDILVRRVNEFVMIQDVVFKDAFASTELWHAAVLRELKTGQGYWICFHKE